MSYSIETSSSRKVELMPWCSIFNSRSFGLIYLKQFQNSLTALLAHRLAILVSIPWYFNGLDDPREIKFLR